MLPRRGCRCGWGWDPTGSPPLWPRVERAGIAPVVSRATQLPFLRGAAVDLLPVEWRVKERLLGFGLRTLEQVVAVGLGPMQAEFGPQGKLAWELATGVDQRPLVHRIQSRSSPARSPSTRLLQCWPRCCWERRGY